MSRQGKDFELAYKWLYEMDQEKYTVTSPAYLYDPFSEDKREIDILVEFYDNNHIKRKMAIECRNRSKKQDVMWIEQLQQKKEDLSLDYILATTTTDFTKGAIKKARKHGVIIEKAESINQNYIHDIVEEKFFCDVFFFKLTFEELLFLNKDGDIVSYKNFFQALSFSEQMELLNELNGDLYYSINPYDILLESNVSKNIFFQNDKDNSMNICDTILFNDDKPAFFRKKDIIMIKYKIKITPFRLSLPLDKSLSVFEVEENINKKYRVRFGNEEEYIELGYIESSNYANINLSQRKYLRLAGGNLNLNTIFPNTTNIPQIDWKTIQHHFGEFDFGHIK